MIDHSHFDRNKNKQSGSPISGEPLLIAVGRIRRPHGVKGEAVYESFPEFSFHLKVGKTVFIGKHRQELIIRSIRKMDQNHLISFEGFEDCDSIGFMRNVEVFISEKDLSSRGENKHYPHQVIGMTVVDEKASRVGILQEVLLTGANDVYVVVNERDEELLLPAIESVVLKVDQENRVMTVRLPIWE